MKKKHPKLRIPYFYLFDSISQICSKNCENKKMEILNKYLFEIITCIFERGDKYEKNIKEAERVMNLWISKAVYSKSIINKYRKMYY